MILQAAHPTFILIKLPFPLLTISKNEHWCPRNVESELVPIPAS